MSDLDTPTIGEIGRAVLRIESAVDRVETAVSRHETDIQMLKQSRSTATWAIGGLWGLFLVVIEWWWLKGPRP